MTKKRRGSRKLTQHDVDYLMQHTSFTEDDIQEWFEEFMRVSILGSSNNYILLPGVGLAIRQIIFLN